MNKRSCTVEDNLPSTSKNKKLCNEKNTATEQALHQLINLCPQDKLFKVAKLPRVVMKHMVYSLIENRTKADKELDELQKNGIIRMFKLGSEQESLAILHTEQYIQLIESHCDNKTLPVIQKFISTIINNINEISVEKGALTHASFGEEEIRFSFPGSGKFMSCFIKGRMSILNAIRKSKFQQILQKDLEERKLNCSLTIAWHIHDIVGSDIVSRLPTSSGYLLKLN